MSIQGVRTCGDYMFSGHTVALTIMNFFITECKTKHILTPEQMNDVVRIFRYTSTPVLFAHNDLAVEYVWHILYSRSA